MFDRSRDMGSECFVIVQTFFSPFSMLRTLSMFTSWNDKFFYSFSRNVVIKERKTLIQGARESQEKIKRDKTKWLRARKKFNSFSDFLAPQETRRTHQNVEPVMAHSVAPNPTVRCRVSLYANYQHKTEKFLNCSTWYTRQLFYFSLRYCHFSLPFSSAKRERFDKNFN